MSDFNTKYEAVIIADGLFPQSESVLELIRDAGVVVCCDGATRKALANGFTPDYIVGDLDSLEEKFKVQFADRLYRFPEQDTNDLTKAVRFTRSKGIKNLLIVGATGLREDHTLGNISLLAQYAELFDSVEMVSDYGTFIAINQTIELQSFPGQQVSIFALTPDCLISTKGLKYPVEKRSFSFWWEGTLNESLGDSFTIEVHGSGRLIIYKVTG
ncbi:thiamine diphosphokinase [Parabacteroides sp. FAFU027]|uniref:thiamine diphosphokinase n=1 Tax=Parabacteroides sp. FAFU027 TaxID=2922715 RepID=UPI001FAFF440|nr:thiamine diphosphokinase [Parabacteroides sp. FAFU027]